MKMADQSQKKILLKIPLLNKEQAQLVSDVLNVDKELKGSEVSREISIDEDGLLVIFVGADYKKLRVTINALLKNINLIVKTLSLFC